MFNSSFLLLIKFKLSLLLGIQKLKISENKNPQKQIMKINLLIIFVISITSCYTSKEHREWDKRKSKGLPDSYFYNVLQDTVSKSSIEIVYDQPYVHNREDTFFHAYTFDKFGKVYSDGWRKEIPTFAKIYERKGFIGYYKLYGDTIVIEQISSWTLGEKIPWKFVHHKKIGIIAGDTIKFSLQSIHIDEKNNLNFPLYNYLILDSNASN